MGIKNTMKHFIFTNEVDMATKNSSKILLNANNLSAILDDGQEVALTNLEYRILMLLHEKENKTVTYVEIGKTLWGDSHTDEQTARVSNVVFHLRTKLGGYGKEHIKTVRSRGYRLVP